LFLYNELSELTRKKQEFSKSLDDLNSMVENKGKADEMLISLQEKNTELENDVNTVRKRLDALNDNLHNVEDSAEQISEIKIEINQAVKAIAMRIKAPANLNHIFPSSLFSNCV
jgi:uncharacterized coiled-coil DUF342 family protein